MFFFLCSCEITKTDLHFQCYFRQLACKTSWDCDNLHTCIDGMCKMKVCSFNSPVEHSTLTINYDVPSIGKEAFLTCDRNYVMRRGNTCLKKLTLTCSAQSLYSRPIWKIKTNANEDPKACFRGTTEDLTEKHLLAYSLTQATLCNTSRRMQRQRRLSARRVLRSEHLQLSTEGVPGHSRRWILCRHIRLHQWQHGSARLQS